MQSIIFFKTGILILFLILLSSGCSNEDDMQTVIYPSPIGKGDLNGSGKEGIQQQNIVISDTAAWNELKIKMDSYNNVTGSFTETEINFSEYIILAAFSELRPLGGCSIEIKNVLEYSGGINVTIENFVPKAGVAEETQPYHIVKIPKTNKQIVFE